jgi:hypothetical protein
MDVVCQDLHIWEAGIRQQIARGVALPLPAVIDIDVLVAGCLHAVGDDGVRDLANCFVIDLGAELVPTVPSHRRGLGQIVGRQIFARRQFDLGQRRVVH